MKDRENHISGINTNSNNYISTSAALRDREMSLDSSSMNDISEYMNNIKDENYKNYIQKKYDLILKIFHEIDTDHNQYIDYEELIVFLNKSMPVIYC